MSTRNLERWYVLYGLTLALIGAWALWRVLQP